MTLHSGYVCIIVAADGTERVHRQRPGSGPLGYAEAQQVGADALAAGAIGALVGNIHTIIQPPPAPRPVQGGLL